MRRTPGEYDPLCVRPILGCQVSIWERLRARNEGDRENPKRRFLQKTADSPFLLETPAYGGRRKPQQTEEFRRNRRALAISIPTR